MRHTYCAALFVLVFYVGQANSQEPPEEDRPPREFERQAVEPLEPLSKPKQPPREAPPREGMPTVIAGNLVSAAIFVAGVIGWIVLGLTVFFLDRRGVHHGTGDGTSPRGA